MIVGQPAEELGDGARAMLADHVYDRFGRPDFVLAEHDVSDIAAGQVGVVSGPFKSSATSLDVVMRGIGGHGAKPEQTKDPVIMAGEFLVMLQTIVSRQNSPQQPAVITVGHIVGGTKRNIIPDEVLMELTMRSFDDAQRDAMIADVQRIAKGIAIAGNVPEDRMPIVTVSKSEYTPVTFNDPRPRRQIPRRSQSRPRPAEPRRNQTQHGQRRLRRVGPPRSLRPHLLLLARSLRPRQSRRERTHRHPPARHPLPQLRPHPRAIPPRRHHRHDRNVAGAAQQIAEVAG